MKVFILLTGLLLFFTNGLRAQSECKVISIFTYIDSKGNEVDPNDPRLKQASANRPSDTGDTASGSDLHFTQSPDTKLYGLADKDGKEVIPCQYTYVSPSFKEGMAAVGKDGKFGVIDATGKLILPIQYTNIPTFYGGFIRIALTGSSTDDMFGNSKIEYLDKSGKPVPALLKYQNIETLSDKVLVAGKKATDGSPVTCVLLNRQDLTEIPSPHYDNITVISIQGKPFAKVWRKEGGFGIIDGEGKLIVPCIYKDISVDNRDIFVRDWFDNVAVIATDGHFIIEPYKYESVGTTYVEGIYKVDKYALQDEFMTTYPIGDGTSLPSFPGGKKALDAWIFQNVHVPGAPRPKMPVGYLIEIECTVGADGTITGYKPIVPQHVDVSHDEEGVANGLIAVDDFGSDVLSEIDRVMKLMPKWIPTKAEGVTVTCHTSFELLYLPKEEE